MLLQRQPAKLSRLQHDAPPPPGWPEGVTYLTRPRLSPTFPAELVPLLYSSPTPTSCSKFAPHPTTHPPTLSIKIVNSPGHPAHGQHSLVAHKRIAAKTLLIPYLGIIHADYTSVAGARVDRSGQPTVGGHEESDYDLSLVRLSASDMRNPFRESAPVPSDDGDEHNPLHVSIGVDAAHAGNAARFVNDFRGIAMAPNAEFRLARGQGGEARMEVWSTRRIDKGEEVLVSYGKGWWGARKS